MLNFPTFVIGSFATYYLALSITREDGPGGVFLALRNRFTADDWIARGVRCLVCMSCWTALLVTLIVTTLGHADPWDWPVTWLGLAGASVVIDKWWRR